MFARLVTAAGVDYVQWRALLRAYVMLDYSALLGAYGPVAARRAGWHLLIQIATFGVLGGMPAFVILIARDPLLAATVMVAEISMLVGMFVLMQAASLVSPDDYAVIGYRPVSSRTYFASRITGVIANTTEIALFCGYFSVGAFLIRSGSVLVTLAAVAAIGASALTATLAVAVLYSWLLHRLTPAQLQRFIALTSVLGVLAISGSCVAASYGLMASDAALSMRTTLDMTLPRTSWALLFPGVWFASYVEVARGAAGWFEWTACALSAVVPLTLALTLRGRLSVDYQARVAQQKTAPASMSAPDPAWGFLRGERRALALLIRHQLRTDSTLQTMLLMDVLMTAGFIYFLSDGWPADPFGPGAGRVLSFAMIWLLRLPASVRQNLMTSAASSASWLFFTTPADRARLVTAGRDLVAAVTVAPMFIVLATLLTIAYGHVGHAILDVALFSTVTFIELQLDVIFDPRLPFSTPVMRDRRNPFRSSGNWRALLVGLPILALFAAMRAYCYPRPLALVLSIVVLAGIVAALEWLSRTRLRMRLASVQYAG